MQNIETTILIKAPAQKVWQVLLDFQNYENWNPFIIKMQGASAVGETLNVSMKMKDGKVMKFTPSVLAVQEAIEFKWRGKLFFPWLFQGEHYFLLKDMGDCCELIHGEDFKGVMLLLMPSLLTETKTSFERMNEALKLKCETPDPLG
jgi:hypothetical protein